MANTSSRTFIQTPSPPLSPKDSNENKTITNALSTPTEYDDESIGNEFLKNQYLNMIKCGIKINNEIIPYTYFIEKLHRNASQMINEKTEDAIPIRVFDMENDSCEEFWIQPIYLYLQSFYFYRIFETFIGHEDDQDMIEIEVPSLQTFKVVLNWLYTGDFMKLLEIAKLNESLHRGILENIRYLEIQLPSF